VSTLPNIRSFPSNLTWDEFLALPYELRNASLVDGEVIVNPPNAQHELIVRNLQILFVTWMRSGEHRGQTSTQQPVKINERRGYQPDFSWYPQEVCSPRDEALSFSGPPGLVVEVLSPSTRTFDMVRKRHDYEHVGLDEVWFVDPNPGEQVVLAYQRPTPNEPFIAIEAKPGGYLTSPVLDGFELDVARLFDR
jgi:Uma2 family endonuclease